VNCGGVTVLRILLVEDNRIYRETFRDSLRQHFPVVSVSEAGNADEALHKIQAEPPDLIFMDIRLPGMNGLQLTQRIKRDFPNIPVVIVTGYDLPEYREASTQYGANGFLVKDSLKWEEVAAFAKSIDRRG
jgi:DNA-binding NarL/FixJ family response regulator